MIRFAFIAMLALGCTDEANSRRTLEAQGFKEIQLGGYSVFGCGKDDNFATEFTATNPAGMRVSGVVCCGLLKNCTLRF